MIVSGTYGSQLTPCNVLVHEGWYCVEGSSNVNFTREELFDGVDVETLSDEDCFTAGEGINSIEELINAINE